MAQKAAGLRLQPIGTTVSSGIVGLDSIMSGGYSHGQATLIRGASGTGKTLFSLMFAATTTGKDHAIFATFDEPVEHLESYLTQWNASNRVTFLDFTVDPDMVMSGGTEVDLGGILVRLENALNKSGARLIILDAFDALFSTFENPERIRHQLHKVFNWCRLRGVTLLATAGIRGSYEESTDVMDYASDCTILLSQNLNEGLMTRKLRVLKLRGRGHGTNEYPFLIDARGISVLPVTDSLMSDKVYRKRISTGIAQLDKMLGGKGFWQGSTVMISGQSGTGKSLLCARLAEQSAVTGSKVLYVSFEESPSHFLRDVKSAGIDLKSQVDAGRCHLVGRRPVELGMEEHIILLLRNIDEFKPDIVIIDPISSLADLGDFRAFKNAALRLCHLINSLGVTTVLTELLPDDSGNVSNMNISSMVDTWIRLTRTEKNGVMHRLIKVHKSRGTATSNRIHGFTISRNGIEISKADEGTGSRS